MGESYKEITSFLNQKYPLSISEKWDNNGLFIPPDKEEVSSVMLTLSLTESVIEKAIKKNSNLIISHHPLTLAGLNNVNPETREGNLLIQLIKNGIGLYVAHSNFDCHAEGLNYYLGNALGLIDMVTLDPIKENSNLKLEFYVSKKNKDIVFEALYALGAGVFNNYDSSCFASKGLGSFKGLDKSNSAIEKAEKLTIVDKVKGEMIIPKNKTTEIVEELKKVNSYEEVDYYLYPIIFNEKKNGLGKVGNLSKGETLSVFLKRLKNIFGCESIEITSDVGNPVIKRVSICGGSGKHLLPLAISKSDIYLTGDLSYHDFEKAAYNKFPLANIGHFYSEKIGLMNWAKMLKDELEVPIYFLKEEGIYSTLV